MQKRFISSRDNPLVKQLRQFAKSASITRQAGLAILDGVHLCQTYLSRLGAPTMCVVGDAAASNAEVAEILSSCEKLETQCVVLPDSIFNTLSQVEHGLQLLFLINIPDQSRSPVPDENSNSLNEKHQISGLAVLLDNVQDPGNVGTILRSAAAAGFMQVFCSPGTASVWSPKVLRAGMGAHFALSIVENTDLATLIADSNIPILATSPHSQVSLYDLDLSHSVAWLFGHEGQGVAPHLLQAAQHQLYIPQADHVESLNVSACAAVCLFETVRQRLALQKLNVG